MCARVPSWRARVPGLRARVPGNNFMTSAIHLPESGAHASSVSSWLRLVCLDTMRFSVSVSHATDSTLLSFAIWISVATIAQCFPPLSDRGSVHGSVMQAH